MRFSSFVSWLKRVVPRLLFVVISTLARICKPDARPALAEDLRKIGVTAIGVGLVGSIVDSASIARGDALLVLSAGAILWTVGLWLSTFSSNKE